MRYLIVSRELPPSSYPPGGIGTYVTNMSRLLAQHVEAVHVIGEQWAGSPLLREEQLNGRLIVHRVRSDVITPNRRHQNVVETPGTTSFAAQRFAWNAALLAESLVETEGIDLIEGQDWEAPLYYLLGRRASGEGPSRMPPCVVHLHSSTEFVFRHNGWTPYRPEQRATIAMERYCLLAADALLSPSAYMAREVASQLGPATPDTTVIPYPIGEVLTADHPPSDDGLRHILYIGRLEPRKGLVEFVQAAVAVASTDDQVCFDFVGADATYRGSSSVRDYMQQRIPTALRGRFRFHGAQPRARLGWYLRQAHAVAVPSRGENFPYTCMEAMSAGVPVLASPNGGMAEMIEDGVTGWVTASQDAGGIAEGLRRALAASSADVGRMGVAASLAIQRLCGNETIVSRHLAWRAMLVERGLRQSREDGHAPGAIAFEPALGVPSLGWGDLLRLPPRELLSLCADVIRHPIRAIASRLPPNRH